VLGGLLLLLLLLLLLQIEVRLELRWGLKIICNVTVGTDKP
jgi:hypothetical protein